MPRAAAEAGGEEVKKASGVPFGVSAFLLLAAFASLSMMPAQERISLDAATATANARMLMTSASPSFLFVPELRSDCTEQRSGVRHVNKRGEVWQCAEIAAGTYRWAERSTSTIDWMTYELANRPRFVMRPVSLITGRPR